MKDKSFLIIPGLGFITCLILFLILRNNTQYTGAYIEKDYVIDTAVYVPLQTESIAQINPYWKVHLKGTNDWVSVNNFSTGGDSMIRTLVLKVTKNNMNILHIPISVEAIQGLATIKESKEGFRFLEEFYGIMPSRVYSVSVNTDDVKHNYLIVKIKPEGFDDANHYHGKYFG